MGSYDSEIYEYQLIYYSEGGIRRVRGGYGDLNTVVKHGRELIGLGYDVSIREVRYIVGWRE